MRNRIAVVVLVLLSMAACVAGPNPLVADAAAAGFLKGLSHGFIFLVTFVISLFSDNVSVYEVHNTGGWYDFGFFLGLTASLGGGSQGTKRGFQRVRGAPQSS